METKVITREEFNEYVLESCINVANTNWSYGFFEDCFRNCPGLTRYIELELLVLICNYPISLDTRNLETKIKLYGSPLWKALREEE